MITCLLVLIDLRAMVEICSDCCSHSLATTFMTRVLACMMMKGVASIDSTMLANTGLSKAGGIRLFCAPSVSKTKPNSPAWAKYKPVRSATPWVAPVNLASMVIRASLKSTGKVVRIRTKGQRSTTMCQSSSMPMVMKNKPNKTSWKGRMSSSTWCLYSVSEINMPAMKAPSARLKPAISVIQASPKVTNSKLSTNSSSLLRRATKVNHQRMTRWPPVISNVIKTVALPAANSKADHISSAGACKAGIMTIRGTTAKS